MEAVNGGGGGGSVSSASFNSAEVRSMLGRRSDRQH